MSKNIDTIDELHEKIHNREQWIVELERQLNFTRAGERVALKCCKELEEQLENAIVPKFIYGQNVWCVYPTNEHRQGFVFEMDFVGYTKDKIICRTIDNEEFEYDEVFATKEEAQAKLEELGGETK